LSDGQKSLNFTCTFKCYQQSWAQFSWATLYTMLRLWWSASRGSICGSWDSCRWSGLPEEGRTFTQHPDGVPWPLRLADPQLIGRVQTTHYRRTLPTCQRRISVLAHNTLGNCT